MKSSPFRLFLCLAFAASVASVTAMETGHITIPRPPYGHVHQVRIQLTGPPIAECVLQVQFHPMIFNQNNTLAGWYSREAEAYTYLCFDGGNLTATVEAQFSKLRYYGPFGILAVALAVMLIDARRR